MWVPKRRCNRNCVAMPLWKSAWPVLIIQKEVFTYGWCEEKCLHKNAIQTDTENVADYQNTM